VRPILGAQLSQTVVDFWKVPRSDRQLLQRHLIASTRRSEGARGSRGESETLSIMVTKRPSANQVLRSGLQLEEAGQITKSMTTRTKLDFAFTPLRLSDSLPDERRTAFASA